MVEKRARLGEECSKQAFFPQLSIEYAKATVQHFCTCMTDESDLEDGPHYCLRSRRVARGETDRDLRFKFVAGWPKPQIGDNPLAYREPKPMTILHLKTHTNSYNSANTEVKNLRFSQHLKDSFKLLTMASANQPMLYQDIG